LLPIEEVHFEGRSHATANSSHFHRWKATQKCLAADNLELSRWNKETSGGISATDVTPVQMVKTGALIGL
jgi:hypothetical protein